MGHEQIEHTADLGLHVWSDSLDGLFEEAALALVEVMGRAGGPPRERVRVEVEAPDPEALLVDWLSEILYLFEAKGLVPVRVRARVSEDPWRVEAEVEGADAASFVQHGPAVKAVTYHGLQLERGPGGARARVYLDI